MFSNQSFLMIFDSFVGAISPGKVAQLQYCYIFFCVMVMLKSPPARSPVLAVVASLLH